MQTERDGHSMLRSDNEYSVLRLLSANVSCLSISNCDNCISSISQCTWCSDKGSCVPTATATTYCDSSEQESSCGQSYYTIVFIVVLSTLLCFCCVYCYYRKFIRKQTPIITPSSLNRPGSSRNFIFRNSFVEEGQQEWMCVVCGFDNHPRNKYCNMCGTSFKFSLDYKAEKVESKKLRKKERLERLERLNDTHISQQHVMTLTNASYIYSPMRNPLKPTGFDDNATDTDTTEKTSTINSTINENRPATATQSSYAFRPMLSPQKRLEAFNYRRLNQLTLRQKSARRRKMWQRVIVDETGELKWVRVPTSEVKVNNAPFGYTPGNSLYFPSYRSDNKSEKSSISDQQDFTQALLSASKGLPFGPSTGTGKSSSSFSATLTPGLTQYERGSRSKGDSFGDDVLLSSSPGFASVFDGDGNLNWERVESGMIAPKAAPNMDKANMKKLIKANNEQQQQQQQTQQQQQNRDLPQRELFPDERQSWSYASRQSFSNNSTISNSYVSRQPLLDINDPYAALEAPLLTQREDTDSMKLAKRQKSREEERAFYYDLETVASLSFKEKQLWFLDRMADLQRPWTDGCIRLEIRRDKMLADSVATFGSIEAADTHKWLRIQFAGEPGVDAGGVEREWFELVTHQLMSAEAGLFICSSSDGLSGVYHINPLSATAKKNHLKYFKFAGRFFGKAIMEQQPISATLSLPHRKQILTTPVTFSDLEFVDPDLYQSLLWLKNNSNVEDLCLDFTISYETPDGNKVSYDLIPNGSNIPVTDDNKLEYLHLRMKHRLFDSVKEQLEQLLIGLYEVIPPDVLSVFDYQELDLLLCGVPEIDVEDWKRHTDYLAEYSRKGGNHKVIKWFWKIVEAMGREERVRLLQFVTGCSRLPAQGFKALQSSDGNYRRFNIQSVSKKDSMYPRAHTCFNKLDLPMYDSEAELEGYLSVVINMDITGFTME